MKIFILGPAYPYRGGIADTNESLARAFQKKDHDVKIITFSMQYPDFLFPGKTQYSADQAPDDLTIERWINSLNPFSWFQTAQKIKKENPDLLIVRYWLPFLAPCFGSINRLLRKKIKIIGFCDNVVPHEKRFADHQLSKYFIDSCEAFISMSTTVRKELSDFTNKKCLVIPHPINSNLGTRIDKNEAKRKIGLETGHKYLMFFGLVRKYKGLDLLLESMRLEKIRNQDIHLLVAGEFYEDKEEYLQFIKENDLNEKVHIVDSFIPSEEIKYYFSACDLVVQTYHTASQSGVSQLALNFDSPILVTDVGGLSETVEHNKMGYVVQKDSEKIQEAIIDYFENEREKTFSEYIRKVKSKYSWSNFVDQLLNFSKSV